MLSESEDSGGGHWKSKSKKQRSSIKDDDLSQPWVCEEIDPFTSCIRYFNLPKKTRMPVNVKTYDGSDDPEDHLKIFQGATKVEHWAMPTWCHMFNSTITGSARLWFDGLPLESIDRRVLHEGSARVWFMSWEKSMKGLAGINIARPFSEGPGKVKFLIVAMDCFTKWIKAKPVATIMGNQVKNFVWDNIVCRFGLPREIISDNGKQFKDNPFKDWCEKLCIRQHFASVKHPQANGLVERANRSLGEGIKARLDERSKDWIEEIPHVLWAHRTMIKSTKIDMVQNDEALEINLDLLEERMEQAAIREARSKAKMEKYYKSKVRNTSFKPGDLV
ncbi:reverse transcriptase domain-containing protein [Tanacetum coccineum]|uniref:Reverse transcriptase domain-containing protein n=1 Tax=Tanacetum coccineum TaxID=301880 RepID=A0ABQ5HSQ2_9ASTR